MVETQDVDSILAAYADVLEEQTDPNVVREATSFGTVPTGTYIGEVVKKEWRTTYKEFQGRQRPPRLRASLQVKLTDPVTGARKGMVFPEASPIINRYESGNLDVLSQLWGQIALIHDAPKRGLTAGKLFEEIGNFPYKLYVQEKFIDETLPDGHAEKFKTANTPEQSKAFKEAGMKGRNDVRRFQAV